MIVVLNRGFQNSKLTLGMIQIHNVDHSPIYTLENPYKDNKPFISCIPEGVYNCSPYNGEKYKSVYEVNDVKGRSDILFHSGNWVHETSGCILLGSAIGEMKNQPALISSVKAVNQFKSLIGRNNFWLIVQ